MNLEAYLSQLNNLELRKTVISTSAQVWDNVNSQFSYSDQLRGLLLGNVQSGKTAQTLGVISRLSDEGFRLFVLLTTDNVYLHKQTYNRSFELLTQFEVLNEHDEIKLLTASASNPLLIVLKKNARVLGRWRNALSSSGLCKGNPLVIIDDEADAASLNTLVNKQRTSTINRHLNSMQVLASSSLYLQVTATPQAVILQSEVSGWKPKFVTYFPPGADYIGGDLIYSDPAAFCIRLTDEDELDNVKEASEFIPLGLRDSLMSFLVVCSDFAIRGKSVCNFLVHPGVRTDLHDTFAERIGEHLNLLLTGAHEKEFVDELQRTWNDLQSTKPNLINFEDLRLKAIELIENQQLKVVILNSKSPIDIDYNDGFNVIVGGNSLGRGITIPKLQTVYYCRKSKTPQADTFWQHSRMFGYDRDPGLLRVFIPPSLHRLFTQLNNSNQTLVKQIVEKGLEGVQLIFPKSIKPTRKNVLDNHYLHLIVGGVNYFPNDPLENLSAGIDSLVEDFAESEEYLVDFEFITELLRYTGSHSKADWNSEKLISCVKALSAERPSSTCRLLIRRGRDIAKGTGTMLSPNDREIGDRYGQSLVLTLYRVAGNKEKGWAGNPFWMPNIKFPEDSTFYDTSN
ncbi:MAG TPA: Z1 domain-containing protein [Pyrinomonadaceae bacterium]|nr:Z1 domain-containing protein [Pyrinomonadaceae bacterium]